jgi:uncharacterized protein (DUF4415 family)
MPTRRKAARASVGRTDWARINSMTDAEIEHMAASDKENPATKQADWSAATIGLPPLKTPVNAKFDVDVVAWFKSEGRGYQTRMNAVLRRYMEAHRKDGAILRSNPKMPSRAALLQSGTKAASKRKGRRP